ncbi:uncharacterized protein PHACADRAFT_199517 [Phanerochaete carnosa HHB-10118-sp]|uniref:Uncharacterized protein n=1 Tax=Phanerochaete carnosa (strain HHB-10118-sp) TaxID=650164 RepID=K5VYV8_PHACS|nr:uncharacterized protein PHACADRAFT_199517 [Phanerochaete carnosa HHB-10118-sp]EKM52015.1 hypothetical protein PHACADRAFT_199517 [Phanerochaete carnosa HHB-10118-sp]
MSPFVSHLTLRTISKYNPVVDPIFGRTCIPKALFTARTIGIHVYHRVSLVLADTTVLVLTWMKTFRHWREARRIIRASLATCLLRDGTIYFM